MFFSRNVFKVVHDSCVGGKLDKIYKQPFMYPGGNGVHNSESGSEIAKRNCWDNMIYNVSGFQNPML